MTQMDKVMDRCGLFGLYDQDTFDTARVIYYGLFSLQHRGVEAAGICVNHDGKFLYKKDKGLVTDVFDEDSLKKLPGRIGIGHVLRYAGNDAVENAQPIVIRYTNGHMAVAMNGGLTNLEELRHELELTGAVFQTMEAAEVVSVLISRARTQYPTIEEAIAHVMPMLKGGYAMLVMTRHKLIGVRDSHGLRPLMLGKKKNSWFLSSETCAFNELDVDYVKDIDPGEIAVINQRGVNFLDVGADQGSALCIFEYIYHSRPDSEISGLEVYKARAAMGRELAKAALTNADAVIWVPDSGLATATGYSEMSGIPLVDAFVKNRYFGTKLLKPDAEMFGRGINMKLSVIRSRVAGKRVVVVDDSMIAGTTAKIFVSALKEAGAKEVHLRISAPPVRFVCPYGAASPDASALEAGGRSVDEICRDIGADSLAFLPQEAMLRACAEAGCGFCCACFDGNYPA